MDERCVMPAEVGNLMGDASKAKEELGWKPKVGFEEMVKMMVDEDIELAKRGKVLVDAGSIDVTNSPENSVLLYLLPLCFLTLCSFLVIHYKISWTHVNILVFLRF